MAKIGLFFGSTGGNTENVANMIKEELGDKVDFVKNVKDAEAGDFEDCDGLILGISTWDDGVPQEDWQDFLPDFEEVDFSGKKVAIFGLGDQQGYSGQFLNATRVLYDVVTKGGATVIGQWPTEGYEFDDSTAVIDNKFVGLAIDEDNESDLTEDRVKEWCGLIAGQLPG